MTSLKWLPTNGWIGFLEGNNPDYPTEALTRDFGTLRRKMQGMHEDTTTPDTRLSDDTLAFNPAVGSNLIELMLGGITPRFGEPLHCRVRYFDPEKRRAGMPADVCLARGKLTDDETTLSLVNINPVEERTVIVQGGRLCRSTNWSALLLMDKTLPINRSAFTVRLAPGAGRVGSFSR